MPKAGTLQSVYMVELLVDIKDYPTFTFFTSKKAIFDFFGNDLGIGYTYSKNLNVKEAPFMNSKCRIIGGHMRSAKQNIEANKEISRKMAEDFKRLKERKKQEEQL